MKKLDRLIKAAIAYADLSQKQIDYEERRTKILQEAANMARAGDATGAVRKAAEVDRNSIVVFDFTDIKKELIAAVKPFRLI